jgi:hypothetical protein
MMFETSIVNDGHEMRIHRTSFDGRSLMRALADGASVAQGLINMEDRCFGGGPTVEMNTLGDGGLRKGWREHQWRWCGGRGGGACGDGGCEAMDMKQRALSIGNGGLTWSDRRQIIDGRSLSLMRELAVVCQCGGDGSK